MRIALGQVMAQTFAGKLLSWRSTGALVLGTALLLSPALLESASAQFLGGQVLGYAPNAPTPFPSDNMMVAPVQSEDDGDANAVVPERLKRAIVAFNTQEAPGTIVIDTGNTQLYYVLGQGRAVRYGVGVGREGFTWSGVQNITKKAEWPDWTPPSEMIARQPYLPRFVAGGPGNPLGARAMYLGSSIYRIHGTNDPSTIGKFVSSGCIRLTNEDVADLFSRVTIGTKVVVLPKHAPHMATRNPETRMTITVRPAAAQARPVMTTATPGRQAMNLSTSSLY
jgi:lipoprotein-anchoring transpeptidase ErfK/SrfK